VHTEVVANIKSRDEILSLLFIVLTLHFSFEWMTHKTQKNLVYLSISLTLALLSKEYAMLLPFMIAIAWYSLLKQDFKTMWNQAFKTIVFITLGFILIRFYAFSNLTTKNKITDVLNDPYLYASVQQAIASKCALILEYTRLFFYPRHLSADYSYSHFPYITFAHWQFIFSLAMYLALAYYFWKGLKKQAAWLFPLSLFLGFFFLINNMVFNIGATMGERLFYHPSLGFLILVVMLMAIFYERLKWKANVKMIALAVLLIPVCILMGFKTIDRNRAWASDYSLFTTDVRTVPNSALANNNAGTEIYNSAYAKYHAIEKPSLLDNKLYQSQLKAAIVYFNTTIAIHDRYVVAYMNRGLCYFHSGQKDKAAEDWMKAASLYNGSNNFLKQNAKIFLEEGLVYGSKKEYAKALPPMITASKINPYDAFIWNNLGGAYFMTGQFKNASDAFAMALSINPNLNDAKNGKGAADAIFELQKAYKTCGVAPAFLRVKF
jgi:tetratricopeptide (TPR) repeat protein